MYRSQKSVSVLFLNNGQMASKASENTIEWFVLNIDFGICLEVNLSLKLS